MPFHGIISKYAGEKFALGFRLVAPDLAEGETISSCVVTITPSGGGSDLVTAGSVSINPDGNEVSQMLQAGAVGSNYSVKFAMTTSLGRILHGFWQVRLVEDE